MGKSAGGGVLAGRDYLAFVAELKERILAARVSAARAVNRDLVLLYWDIGRGIHQRQERLGWGEAVIERLGVDLRKAFPSTTGFSARNLRNMKQFYEAYRDGSIWQQLVAKLNGPTAGPPQRKNEIPRGESHAQQRLDVNCQILAEVPWGHHILLLNKVEESAARLYYLQATARFGWSRNVLLNQIKAGAYERSLAEGKTHNFPLALPEYLAEQAEESLKSSYNLEFLGIRREIKERELEDRLIEQLQRFILELGYGFCFVGRQYRLTLGSKEYFVDLLFYHRFLKALVAIELKVGPFAPEYAGKMDFYLNLLNDKERNRSHSQARRCVYAATDQGKTCRVSRYG
jgi:predicted nuclease of restriction endonuclease-like (RecB) superfamily